MYIQTCHSNVKNILQYVQFFKLPLNTQKLTTIYQRNHERKFSLSEGLAAILVIENTCLHKTQRAALNTGKPVVPLI